MIEAPGFHPGFFRFRPRRISMQLTLQRRVSRDTNAEPDDVRALKKALNRLSYYIPDKKSGITKIADDDMIEALKKFQSDQKLKPDGIIIPDGETVQALNKALAKQAADKSVMLQWHCAGDRNSCNACIAYDKTIVETDNENTPGCAGTCRCWVTPWKQDMPFKIYDPTIKPVYPEFLLIPSLRLPRFVFKIVKRMLQKNANKHLKSGDNELTDHGALRISQRKITRADIEKAKETAIKTNNVIVKKGKYGTPQNHYKGSNGITVVEETQGRNAGKIITTWYHK